MTWLGGRSTALAPPCLLATRSHILKLQFNAPNSISVGAPLQTPLGHWVACSPPQTPYLDFRGPTSKGSEGRGRGEKGKWRGGNERGKGRKGRQAPPSPPPSQFATPLGRRSGEAFAASGTLGDLTWLEDFLTSK